MGMIFAQVHMLYFLLEGEGMGVVLRVLCIDFSASSSPSTHTVCSQVSVFIAFIAGTL